MLETYRGPQFLINWIKCASRWFHYTYILVKYSWFPVPSQFQTSCTNHRCNISWGVQNTARSVRWLVYKMQTRTQIVHLPTVAGDCSLFRINQRGSGAHLRAKAIVEHVHGSKKTGCVKINFHHKPLSKLRMNGATHPPPIRLHDL
jgi:hypothetical protein